MEQSANGHTVLIPCSAIEMGTIFLHVPYTHNMLHITCYTHHTHHMLHSSHTSHVTLTICTHRMLHLSHTSLPPTRITTLHTHHADHMLHTSHITHITLLTHITQHHITHSSHKSPSPTHIPTSQTISRVSGSFIRVASDWREWRRVSPS